MPQAYRERWFTSQDNLRLYYRDYGDPMSPDCPIVCLTGLTRNSKDFSELAERLSARHRVICPDYRGRGRSAYDPDWRNYVPRTYVGDLFHMVTAAGLHRFLVIGTSLGGLLAMAASVAAPSMLAGVVLNDVGPDIETDGLQRIVDYIGVDRPQDSWEDVEAMMRRTFPGIARDDATLAKLARNTFREMPDGKLHFDWDVSIVKPIVKGGDIPQDLWSLYRGLKNIPTLAIRGGLSTILSERCFDKMAEEKPDLARVTIQGVGHAPSLSEPESLEAIDAFVTRF